MFSGLVESHSPVLSFQPHGDIFRLQVVRPKNFTDISRGDSIAVNGVCLTVENYDDNSMDFAVGPETLKRTQWQLRMAPQSQVNLERSLRFGDRVHGHLVSGHVDGLGQVTSLQKGEKTLQLGVEVPSSLVPLVWEKGSIALNGVSLTINEVKGNRVSVCLIPETLMLTNLGSLEVGQNINVEADYLTRGWLNYKERLIESNI